MKKLLLSLTFLTYCFLNTNAQGVDFGLKAGLNMAKITGDIEDVDLKSGFHGGVFLNLNLSEKFAISPEVLFSQQGAKAADGVLKLDYINIPVLAKISFAKVFNIHFGPQFGFLMSAKEESVDMKEFYKSTDLSLAGGLGLDLPMGLTGGLRYNVGLGNVMDAGSLNVTNQYFQVYVGYRLF